MTDERERTCEPMSGLDVKEARRIAKITGRPLEQVLSDMALAAALNPPEPRRGELEAYGCWQIIPNRAWLGKHE